MSTQPKRFCAYDLCHEFEPGSHNARYCIPCSCKHKREAAVKRSQAQDPEAPEILWELQENRKRSRLAVAQAKNEWLLDNKRFVFFDIETFDLSADFGLLMVGCIKDRKGKIETFIAHGDQDERECAIGIRDELEKADFVVTYFGSRFDLPYLNSRLLVHNERPVNEIRHVDIYYTARNNLRLQRNRLANVEMALLGTGSKTAILPGIWRRALQGDKEALDYIVDHCQKDVEVLEAVFERLRGFRNLSATRWRRYGGSY